MINSNAQRPFPSPLFHSVPIIQCHQHFPIDGLVCPTIQCHQHFPTDGLVCPTIQCHHHGLVCPTIVSSALPYRWFGLSNNTVSSALPYRWFGLSNNTVSSALPCRSSGLSNNTVPSALPYRWFGLSNNTVPSALPCRSSGLSNSCLAVGEVASNTCGHHDAYNDYFGCIDTDSSVCLNLGLWLMHVSSHLRRCRCPSGTTPARSVPYSNGMEAAGRLHKRGRLEEETRSVSSGLFLRIQSQQDATGQFPHQ